MSRSQDTRAPADTNGAGAPHYSAQDARGGEIILRTRGRRMIFIAGLAGIVLLALLVRFAL